MGGGVKKKTEFIFKTPRNCSKCIANDLKSIYMNPMLKKEFSRCHY